MYKKTIVTLLIFLVSMSINWQANAKQSLLKIDKVISVNELNSDFDLLVQSYYENHPAPHRNADPQELSNTIEYIRSKLNKPMTIIETWRLYSLLNPVFRDAHAGIFMPRRKSIIKQQLEAGDRLLPLHAFIDEDNRLYLSKTSDTKNPINIGSEILSINGRTSTDIVAKMLRHAIGDNTKHQRALLSNNFSEAYWAVFGADTHYKIQYLQDDSPFIKTLTGTKTFLKPWSSEQPFDSLFNYKLLNNGTGYLRIKTFITRGKRDAFFAFTKEAFSYFKQAKVTNLIIDISNNPGGQNPSWQKGIMPYITDKPFRHVSDYIAKVTEDNAGPEDTIGEVVSGIYDKMTQPDLTNPLRFTGNVYVLINTMTYSSAIAFAVTVQDHDIAKIIGSSTGGRAGSSGNAAYIFLPATGIEIDVPVILFGRPSGKDNMLAVRPDIVMQHNPFNIEEAIKGFADNLVHQVSR